jgi:DNA uptake protein ComE-like DNA-binding protein
VAVLQEADPNLVNAEDDWAVLGENGSQEFTLGESTFRLEIVDAGSLVNVNGAPEEQLQLLPIEQELIDGLLDWREDGFQPRADGAKDEYYNDLEEPYNARLGSLATVSELLLIKGWTARTLFAPQTEVVSSAPVPEDADGDPLPLAALLTVDSGAPNTRAGGEARVNLNQAGLSPAALAQLGLNPLLAVQIAARAPYASFSSLLSQPGMTPQINQQLLDAVTFTGGARIEGKINLNTATEAVLQTLPNMTPDVAAEIVSRQAGGGFTSLGELATIPGLSGALLPQVADAVAVGSDTWIVRAYGESGGVGVAVEAVVGLRDEKVQVRTWDRLSSPGIPEWWDWDEEPAATVEAGAGL